MADKKLKISLDIDDKAFNSAVKRMQEQLSQIQSAPMLQRQQQSISQKMQQLGLGPLPGAPTPQQSQQVQQKAKQDSDKLFEETRRKMELIKRLQNDLNKEQDRGLATEERKLRIRERLVELGQLEKRTTGGLTALMEGKGPPMPPSGGGGGAAGGGDFLSMAKTVLGVMGIGVGASALVNLGKQVYTSYVSAPAQMNLATGSAIQNTIGYQNQNLLSGDVASATLLQNQMGKGRGLAEKNFDAQLTNKFYSLLSKAGDVGSGLSNYILGTNLDTGRFSNQFQTNRANEIGKSTLEQAQSSLAQNNSLMLAQGFFGQNFNRDLNAQRSLGLGTDQFQRMQMTMNNSGFLTDQGLGMLNQIQGAGGSASGANAGRLANLGLGAQRGMNITNAGNVLGKLTGLYGAGGIEQTEETTKRILEESIKKGFDKSENTEIIRKFVETSADIVYKGEGTKGEDVERLTKDFSQLLSDNPSIKQFEAASSAYQRYQGITSETSGRGGALGFAAFAGNKSFSKLSPLQINTLQSLPEGRVTATNSDIVAAAVEQGISPKEMAEQVLGAKRQQSLSTVGVSQKQMGALKGYLGGKDIGSLMGNETELKKLQSTNPEAYQAYQALQQRADLSGKSGSDEEKKEMMKQLFLGPAAYGAVGGTETAAGRVATGTGGKRGEEYIAAQAGAEKQMVLNLKALQDNLYPTADGISKLTQAIIGLGNAAHMLTDEERARGVGNAAVTRTVDTKASVTRTSSTGSRPRPGQ
jgi:hypothetical protein